MSVSLRGRAFIDGAIHEDALITTSGRSILRAEKAAGPETGAERVEGLMIPGLIDMHVHGGAGSDFMDADLDANRIVRQFHLRHGTTALAATTLSAAPADLAEAVDMLARSATIPLEDGASICAIHLEGPYINPFRAGAQDRSSLRAADAAELISLIERAPRLRWVVTVAPEIEGVLPMIDRFRDRVLFSIGHTDCSYSETLAAFDLGARHVTHMLNAMKPLHHREPGPAGAATATVSSTAELIADGIHIHPVILRLMPDRIALVTDAMRACGMPDGTYKLYEHDVIVSDGAARLEDGTLAGSVLTMIDAVRNMVELAVLPIEAVIPLATEVPARALGLERKGRLRTGFDADLLVISPKFQIERILLHGEEVSLA